MNIWITGCSGFLGRRLTKHFSERGHNVLGLSRRGCAIATESIEIDLSDAKSRATLRSLLTKQGVPDSVIHAAAQQPGPYDLSTFVNSNVRSASNLTEALSEFLPKQVIYTSTHSVYGRPASLPVNETRPAGGQLPYGATKRWAEQLFENMQTKSQVIVLRLPSLYGAGQADSFIDGLARTAQEGGPIELFNNGELVRDALHVSDVVKAIDSCVQLTAAAGFSVINLGCGAPRKTSEWARGLIDALNSRSDIIPVDRPASHFDFYADVTEARSKLDFEPMSLRESMTVYANELRASS
jgi:UDP-glucose 4-epimerase